MTLDDLKARTRNFLSRRKMAYVAIFNGPQGETVLADLAKFCRATETTFHTDPRAHAVLEGRREVWLRIQQNLNLTPDQLWKLVGRPDLD